MKKFFSIILLGFTLIPFTAKADIAPEPGYHDVTSCAFFDNLSDYPTFDVYNTSHWRFGPSAALANPSSEIDTALSSEYGCGNTGQPFFAINESNQKNIVHESDDERGDLWDTLPENTKYFINATTTGKPTDFSDELVYGNMPDSNPTATYVSIYHIDSLTNSTFTAHLVSEAQYDETGKLLSQTTSTETSSKNTPYIVFGAIVVIGIGLLTLAWKTISKK